MLDINFQDPLLVSTGDFYDKIVVEIDKDEFEI